jgi:hypothetical protein
MTTKQVEIYYHYDEKTREVYHSHGMVEDRPDLIFLGSSFNPDKRMAVAAFTQDLPKTQGWKIKPLPLF